MAEQGSRQQERYSSWGFECVIGPGMELEQKSFEEVANIFVKLVKVGIYAARKWQLVERR